MNSSDKRSQNLISLKIEDVARGGSGVARDADGRIVFVPFTAPGDQITAQVTGTKKNYAYADLVELVSPGEMRIKPRCPVFQKCGGCQWQHLPYEFQFKTKVKGLKTALSRFKVVAPDNLEELPAERFFEYRNRIQLRGTQNTIGFFARGSRVLVPIDRCDIARPEINAVIAETKKEGSKLPREYKVEIEVLEDGKVEKTWNSGHAARGFRQVHDEQNEKLKNWVASQVPDGARVLDLFGGRGNLTKGIAHRLKTVVCVDVGTYLKKEIPAGTPENMVFFKMSVWEWLKKNEKTLQADVAILDPPREGLGKDHKQIAAILKAAGIRKLICVGCDADAWASDVFHFGVAGFKVEKTAALDLFPQTPHVECLATLVR